MPRRRVLAIAAAAALLIAARAFPSTVLRAAVEDLARVSDAAYVGTVLDHAVSLDRAAGAIRTDFRLRVSRTLIGPAAETLVVRIPGGRVGTIEQETLGAARLADGERVVVFLSPEADGARGVVGLAQGVFHIEKDPRSGEETCRNSLEGLSVVAREGDENSPEPIRMRLADLESRVVAERERAAARRRAAAEAVERRLAALRLRAEANRAALLGRPGGIEAP